MIKNLVQEVGKGMYKEVFSKNVYVYIKKYSNKLWDEIKDEEIGYIFFEDFNWRALERYLNNKNKLDKQKKLFIGNVVILLIVILRNVYKLNKLESSANYREIVNVCGVKDRTNEIVNDIKNILKTSDLDSLDIDASDLNYLHLLSVRLLRSEFENIKGGIKL